MEKPNKNSQKIFLFFLSEESKKKRNVKTKVSTDIEKKGKMLKLEIPHKEIK